MRRSAALAVGLAFLVTGCGGASAVSGDEVAKEASDQLAAQVGRAPEKVTCPDDLEAEKGAEVRCTLTDSGQSYGVTVTVTSVKDDKVNFDVVVDDKPLED